MRHFTLTLILTAAATLAVACGRTTNPADWTVTIQPLPLAAAASSSAPQLTTSSRGTLISWIELVDSTSVLKFSEYTGKAWSAPRTVATGDDWFLSYADVPSVLRLSDGTLAANLLLTTDADAEAYNLALTYSHDEGKTWAPPFLTHHDNTKTQHGFASLVEMPGSGLGVLWLDGRDAATSTAFEGGNMAVRFASFDKSWKQTADAEVDGRVCECCPTSAVVTADGVLTAFRDRSKDEIRDIHVSLLQNGAWGAATPVHKDNWEVLACPVNGPMLSASGRTVAAAWFTAKDDKGQAWAAFSKDAGRTWGEPIRLDDGESRGRVDVALLDDGSAAATWVEFADKRSQFRVRRVDQSGGRSPAVTIAGTGVSNGFPRIARQGDQLIFAWGEGQTVKAAAATLP